MAGRLQGIPATIGIMYAAGVPLRRWCKGPFLQELMHPGDHDVDHYLRREPPENVFSRTRPLRRRLLRPLNHPPHQCPQLTEPRNRVPCMQPRRTSRTRGE
eukprot:6807679-Pyramimonas_sp.AAC.1